MTDRSSPDAISHQHNKSSRTNGKNENCMRASKFIPKYMLDSLDRESGQESMGPSCSLG